MIDKKKLFHVLRVWTLTPDLYTFDFVFFFLTNTHVIVTLYMGNVKYSTVNIFFFYIFNINNNKSRARSIYIFSHLYFPVWK